jgi:hypothetical protein
MNTDEFEIDVNNYNNPDINAELLKKIADLEKQLKEATEKKVVEKKPIEKKPVAKKTKKVIKDAKISNKELNRQLEMARQEEEKQEKKRAKIIKKGNKSINFKGNLISFKNEDVLAQKLKIDKNDIESLFHTKYILNKNTGIFDKFSIEDEPKILKDFGIKTIQNKKLAQNQITLRRNKQNITITNDIIKWGVPMSFRCEVDILFSWYNGHEWKAKRILDFKAYTFDNKEDFENVVLDVIKSLKFDRIGDDARREITKIRVFNNSSGNIFDILDMGLRDEKPLKISMFNETLGEHKNCVKALLLKKYGSKMSKKTIEQVGNDEGINCHEIKDFCMKYNIKMIAYDINKNVVSEYHPTKINKNYGSLIFTIYNNHIYELNNDYLKKTKIEKVDKFIYVKDTKNKLIEFLKNGILPENINIFGTEISRFYVDNICYHNNNEYEKVKEVLNKFGLIDKLNITLTLSNVSSIIDKLYIKENLNSVFPYQTNNNGGYNYYNDKISSKDKNLVTIDQNKHYSYVLKNLKYLLRCDIKHAKHIKNPSVLDVNYIYVAKPIKSSILMPCADYYTGEFLMYCMDEKIQFEVLEGLECNIIEKNYYAEMIDDLLNKLDNDTFKEIVNRMIGRFNNKPYNKEERTKFFKIANKDETIRTPNAEYIELDENYNLMFTLEDSISNIYSKKPIRMQIIEGSRKQIYEKMKSLKLKDCDIKQIKTDAITFLNKNKLQVENDNSFGGWKKQEETIFFNYDADFYNNDVTFELKSMNDTNEIYLDYAGSGKTHHIINNLLPKLDDYIVLTPSHASLKEYRKNNKNSAVIQVYTLSNLIPEEKNIIIDEIGMCNGQANDLLLKCSLYGKNIYSFGDMNQLKPVNDEKSNSMIFLNLLYKHIKSLGTNYRNDFTKEYYDYLLNEKDMTKLYKEIEKYNCKSYDEAEIIICYTNDLRNGNDDKKIDGYNQLMLQKLNLKWGDIGTLVCCRSNDLRDKKIFNNFYYKITNNKDGIITINDEIQDKTITENEFNKYFCGGYCRTLYNIQGESVRSFYYPPEEYKYLDNEAVYTLISRLKTK